MKQKIILLTTLLILSGCVWNTRQVAEIIPQIQIKKSDIQYAHEAVKEVVIKFDLEPDPWPCKRREKLNLKYCVGYSTKNPEEMRKDLLLIVSPDGFRMYLEVDDSEDKNSKKAEEIFTEAVTAFEKQGTNYRVEVNHTLLHSEYYGR